MDKSDRCRGASGRVRGSSRGQQGQRPLLVVRDDSAAAVVGRSGDGNCSVCGGGGASRSQQK